MSFDVEVGRAPADMPTESWNLPEYFRRQVPAVKGAFTLRSRKEAQAFLQAVRAAASDAFEDAP